MLILEWVARRLKSDIPTKTASLQHYIIPRTTGAFRKRPPDYRASTSRPHQTVAGVLQKARSSAAWFYNHKEDAGATTRSSIHEILDPRVRTMSFAIALSHGAMAPIFPYLNPKGRGRFIRSA